MKYEYCPEHLDQPDVKLKDRGANTLTLQELIAVILVNSGTPKRELRNVAKDVADVLLTHTYKVTISDLVDIDGIGFTKATQLIAALELARRFPPELQRHAVLNSTDDVLPFVEAWRYDNQENVIVITLSGANEVLNVHPITRGTVNQSQIHSREVLAPCIEDHAASFILVHNHPSGILTPSPQDIMVTEKTKQAAELLGITLLDHLIIGPKRNDQPNCRSVMD